MSKIIRLAASNVKRLKAIEVRPEEGKLVVVRGKNRQGKSSLLDAIRYAFAGKGSHPRKVIREGEREAEVIVETEDFTVLRRWEKKAGQEEETTELEVRAKADNSKLKAGQSVLDKFVLDVSFDPLAFTRLDAKKQLEELKRLVGVDTGAIERARANFFEKRTQVNREHEKAAARLASMPAAKPPPKVDVGALQERSKLHSAAIAKLDDAGRNRDGIKKTIGYHLDAVKTAELALAQAKKRLAESEAHYAEADNLCDDLREAAEPAREELVSIEGQIREASAINTANALWDERARAEVEVRALKESADTLTGQIKDLDEKKAAMISAAKFPVPGLGFGADGVLLNGLPLEQASSAEQIRLSVAIGAARNPKLKVMTVREGSLLDAEALAELEHYANEAGAQVWLEAVGEEGAAAVVIRDGEAV